MLISFCIPVEQWRCICTRRVGCLQVFSNGVEWYCTLFGHGSAFGALGGDISSMSSNPAGLGIYRSSEIVTTLSLSSIKAKSDWGGSKVDANKTKFNLITLLMSDISYWKR